MKANRFKTVAVTVCLLLLIFCAPDAQSSAREAVALCLEVLIPSLFPFFICSVTLTGSLNGQTVRVLRPLEKLFRIPRGSVSLLLVGFLGGYPSGVQSIAQASAAGQLSRAESRRMAAFCNNAGPAFLFGMVSPFFDCPAAPWVLWAIHIISAWLVSVVIPPRGGTFTPGDISGEITLPEALEKSLKITASVCGWVILFRVGIGFLKPVIHTVIPLPLQVLLTGALELSNGCISLGDISCTGLRFVTASVLLAFGGVCVTMQTRSVCGDLSMDLYLPGKLLQTAFSFLLSLPLQVLLFPASERYAPASCVVAVPLALTAIGISKLKSSEIKGSIPFPLGV